MLINELPNSSTILKFKRVGVSVSFYMHLAGGKAILRGKIDTDLLQFQCKIYQRHNKEWLLLAKIVKDTWDSKIAS